MTGVSTNIILGQLAPLGTGSFGLLLDDTRLADAIEVRASSCHSLWPALTVGRWSPAVRWGACRSGICMYASFLPASQQPHRTAVSALAARLQLSTLSVGFCSALAAALPRPLM